MKTLPVLSTATAVGPDRPEPITVCVPPGVISTTRLLPVSATKTSPAASTARCVAWERPDPSDVGTVVDVAPLVAGMATLARATKDTVSARAPFDEMLRNNRGFGLQRGVIVASRSQLGFPAQSNARIR